MDAIERGWCGGVRGHEDMFGFEGRRLFVRCVKCGRETGGLLSVRPVRPSRRMRVSDGAARRALVYEE